jgi:pyridoxamine 5'-phosphate oxidase
LLRNLSNKQTDYKFSTLDEHDLDKNPFNQFAKWLDEALEHQLDEPAAMVLSTVGKSGKPSSRLVLLKELTEEGFVFYTNYLSKKGKEIALNPNASLVFFWAKLERQVRIEGMVEKLDPKLSDEYFSKRPLDRQLGAVISPQSEVIPDREFLMKKKKELEQETKGEKIERPDYWGGYILKPNLFEFWQGRPNRLNDRLQYELKDKGWRIVRLGP